MAILMCFDAVSPDEVVAGGGALGSIFLLSKALRVYSQCRVASCESRVSFRCGGHTAF